MKIDRPIAIAVMLFLTLVAVVWLLIPKYKEFRETRYELGRVEAEYSSKYEYYSEISKIFSELQKNEEGVKKIEDALPEKTKISDLMYFLQKKSSENGLIVRNLYLTKISDTGTKSKIKEIVFTIDLMGTYSSLKNFLLGVENSARLFEVNNISFGNSDSKTVTVSSVKTTGGSQKQMSVSDQTYSFKVEIKTHSY